MRGEFGRVDTIGQESSSIKVGSPDAYVAVAIDKDKGDSRRIDG